MSRNYIHRRKGITLILAIMIMSAVVAIGITLTSVLVFQVRINKVTREGHQGYYAAESGIELGLNKLKTLKSGTLDAAVQAIKSAELPSGADPDYEGYFCLDGSCAVPMLDQSDAVGSEKLDTAVVQENQSIFVELYNVDDSLNGGSTDFSSPTLCVYAESVDGANDEILEVSWVAWDESLFVSRPQKIFVHYSAFSVSGTCGSYPGFPVPLTQFYPAFIHGSLAGLRIRITPVSLTSTTPSVTGNGDVQNLQVHTSPVVSSQIQLKSVSDAAGQKQALVAFFPWSLPLSGLFDFVIFSEKTLIKDTPISISQDLKRYGPHQIGAPNCAGNPLVCTIPSAPEDPFSSCSGVAPCSLYVRLIANPATWTATGAEVNTSGTGGPQTLLNLNAASCILRNPFIFTATSNTITFTNKPANLTSYELLTRPAFSSADENFCP